MCVPFRSCMHSVYGSANQRSQSAWATYGCYVTAARRYGHSQPAMQLPASDQRRVTPSAVSCGVALPLSTHAEPWSRNSTARQPARPIPGSQGCWRHRDRTARHPSLCPLRRKGTQGLLVRGWWLVSRAHRSTVLAEGTAMSTTSSTSPFELGRRKCRCCFRSQRQTGSGGAEDWVDDRFWSILAGGLVRGLRQVTTGAWQQAVVASGAAGSGDNG